MALSAKYSGTVTFCLALMALFQCLGGLIVLRHPPTDDGNERKLTCVSEDDDAEFIWNCDRKRFFTDFYPLKTTQKMDSDCAVWNSTLCVAKWKMEEHWNVVDSNSKSITPVLDYRWEGFREFVFGNNEKEWEYRYVKKFDKTFDVAVFSVRGTGDVNIILCRNEDPMRGSYVWITINENDGNGSTIRTCNEIAPDFSELTEAVRCNIVNDFTHKNKSSVYPDPRVWRTFGLKFDNKGKKVQVFKNRDVDVPFLEGTYEESMSYMFLATSRTFSGFRFHRYKYFSTSEEDQAISTEEFPQQEENLCLEILVGVCPTCRFEFTVVNGNGDKVTTKSISGEDENSIFDGLLVWKFVEIKAILRKPHPSEVLRLKVRINLRNGEGKGRWAMDDFRICKSLEMENTSSMDVVENNGKVEFELAESEDDQNLAEQVHRNIRIRERFKRQVTTYERDCKGKPKFTLAAVENYIMIKETVCGGALGILHNTIVTNVKRNTNLRMPCPQFPCNVSNCQPNTKYLISLFDVKNTLVFNETFLTPALAPPHVRNLRVTKSSDTDVRLQWDRPSEENGTIVFYNVTIETTALLGCRDLKIPTPSQSEIIIQVFNETANVKKLHPYANYTATVIAHTSSKSGQKQTCTFQTEASKIPTSTFTDLRIMDGRFLQWKDPEDCRTISGPTTHAALHITGVSEWAKNYRNRTCTKKASVKIKEFNLKAYTTYNVHLYVVRGCEDPVNTTCYQELNFTTAPKPPPSVTELELYDIDIERKVTGLRWKPPYPPNGEIDKYYVVISDNGKEYENRIFAPLEGLNCSTRINYVCIDSLTIPSDVTKNIRIKMYARNKNINGAGKDKIVHFNLDMIRRNSPYGPINVTTYVTGIGKVRLKWVQPFQINSTKIVRFEIQAHLLKTYLFVRPDEKWSSSIAAHDVVGVNLYELETPTLLVTCTIYDISIMAVNQLNFTSEKEWRRVKVPAGPAFARGEKPMVKRNGTVIHVEIPAIANPTRNTTVTVFVKGPCYQGNHASQYSSSTNLTECEWIMHEYKAEWNLSKTLTFNIDHENGSMPRHRSVLKLEGTYRIRVSVNDSCCEALRPEEIFWITLNDDVPSLQTWIIALILVLVMLAIGALLLALWYRKRSKVGRDELVNLPLSHYAMATGNSTVPCTPTPSAKSQIQHFSPDFVPYSPSSYCIKIEEFGEYVKEALASGLLDSQYAMVSNDATKTTVCGGRPENAASNRYKNVIAYDDNRVVLDSVPGDPSSDYINASYIQGYRRTRAYIATQGPKPNTVKDFWRMVWQEDVRVICMLTNVVEGRKTKCEKYWPEVGTRLKYGDILVSNTGHEVFADYTFRTFRLGRRKEKREVTHLHYTGWPDHGIPMYSQSLAAYLKKLLATPSGNGPVVVHCSAGVGRTGTIILCAICLRRAVKEEVIDVPDIIERIRRERAYMVDSVQQYLLAHLIILECMTPVQTQIPCTKDLPQKIKELRRQLQSDVERLDDIVWQDRALHDLAAPRLPSSEDVAENGFFGDSQAINLSNAVNPELSETFDSHSNYIKVVNVDGVKLKKQYLASHLPSVSTLFEYWRLIAEKDIELVIVLQESDPYDATRCDIMPRQPLLMPVPYMRIEMTTNPTTNEHLTIYKLSITDTSEDAIAPRPVTILSCTGWERDNIGKPPNVAALVSLWAASEKISRKKGSTLVLCRNGVTGCGLYLAMSFLLERMAVERECDVIAAVRAVRRFRPEYVQSLEQLEYLYDAALNYVEYFQTYANFS